MSNETATTRVQDPVCGMAVDPATAKYTSEYRGRPFYFCSLMCQRAFEDDPRYNLTEGRHGTAGAEER